MKRARRRWLRVSLRSFLIIMLLLGTGLGWIGAKRTQSRRQRDAVLAVVELSARCLIPGNPFVNDYWAKMCAGNEEPHALVFDSGPVGQRRTKAQWLPNWLRQLTGEEWLHKPVSLNLDFREIDDDHLRVLAALPTLQSLNLAVTNVTDAGIEQILPLQHLRHLSLGYTRLTDPGVRKLRGFHALQSLELWGTNITDDAIESLASIKTLKKLNLCGTHVTEVGIAQLKHALPECCVWWDGHESIRLIHRLRLPSETKAGPAPSSLIRVANHLHSLGRGPAIEVLSQYLKHIHGDPRDRPSLSNNPFAPGFVISESGVSDRLERVCLILPLLFEGVDLSRHIPLQPGLQVRRLRWGDPIRVVGDIPFRIPLHIRGEAWLQRLWMEGGLPKTGRGHEVRWEKDSASFRSAPLQPVDDPFSAARTAYDQIYSEWSSCLPQLAADDPVAQSLRQAIKHHIWEQAETMVAHLNLENPEQAKLRWDDEQQEYILDE